MDEKIAHLLFKDESIIRDYQALQHTWFLKGKQRVIQTRGKHRGVKRSRPSRLRQPSACHRE